MTGTGLQRSSARAGRSAWCVSGTDPTSATGRLVQRAGNDPDSNTGVYGSRTSEEGAGKRRSERGNDCDGICRGRRRLTVKYTAYVELCRGGVISRVKNQLSIYPSWSSRRRGRGVDAEIKATPTHHPTPPTPQSAHYWKVDGVR